MAARRHKDRAAALRLLLLLLQVCCAGTAYPARHPPAHDHGRDPILHPQLRRIIACCAGNTEQSGSAYLCRAACLMLRGCFNHNKASFPTESLSVLPNHYWRYARQPRGNRSRLSGTINLKGQDCRDLNLLCLVELPRYCVLSNFTLLHTACALAAQLPRTLRPESLVTGQVPGDSLRQRKKYVLRIARNALSIES